MGEEPRVSDLSRCNDWTGGLRSTQQPARAELKGNRAATDLAGSSVQSEGIPQLLLRNGSLRVNFVSEHEEGDLGKLLDREKSIELRLGLVEALNVLRIDEEDDAVDFGEVVLPQTAGCGNFRQANEIVEGLGQIFVTG